MANTQLQVLITNPDLAPTEQTLDNDQIQLLSLDIVREVNKIPWARLTLADGDLVTDSFSLSAGSFFILGATIELRVVEGKMMKAELLFTGLVTKHSIKADGGSGLLIVELKDLTFQMTRVRRTQVYNGFDSEIIKNIIRRKTDTGDFSYALNKSLVSDLNISIPQTNLMLSELVQYHCTDWDFILSRAEANGCWVMIKNQLLPAGMAIDIKTPEIQNPPVATFEYASQQIYSFHMEMDGRNYYDQVDAYGLDINNIALTAEGSQTKFSLEQQTLVPTAQEKQLDNHDITQLGGDQYQVIHPVAMDKLERQNFSSAQVQKTRSSLYKGQLKVAGAEHYKINQGDTIEIKKIATQFNGLTLVTGIRHQINQEGWFAHVQFGTSAQWFTEENQDIEAPLAGGLLPAIKGLHIGKVEEIVAGEIDKSTPEEHYKVKVTVVGQDSSIWARLASPYAGDNHGFFFRPEIGDEVVLGFLNNDPRHAIILGALYSRERKPDESFTPEEIREGQIKQIKTKSGGSTIQFFDGDLNEMEIGVSPAASTEDSTNQQTQQTFARITLSSQGTNNINIVDGNGNSISMGENGISIKSADKISIESAQDKSVEITGKFVQINDAKIDKE